MATTLQALRPTAAATRCLEAELARTDTRSWVMERRERTGQLIELGGLVRKAGLEALVEDDRAALYGALLNLADMLQDPNAPNVQEAFRRRGKRAFEAEAADAPPIRTFASK